MKKKILFVIHQLNQGGAQRVLLHLMNNIDRDKFEIHLAIFKNIGEFKNDLRNDILIHDLNTKTVKRGVFKLYKLIKKLHPDIVFSGIAHVNLMLSLLIPFLPKDIKFIARETNTVSMNIKEEKYIMLYTFLYKNFYNNFDIIICQSNFMKQDLVENYGIYNDKVVVINNPIDIEYIQKKIHTDKKIFKNKFFKIVAVGGLRKQKGVDFLLKSISMLDSNYHLTIVGEGRERKYLEKLIDELNIHNKVSLVGFQSNPYIYMAQADLMVLSSRYEGFPNVVLEANACGTPVVAFDCPGGTSEIIEDGVNGFLVECGNIYAFKEGIEKAIKTNWDRDKIITKTKERYGIENIIKKYEKIL